MGTSKKKKSKNSDKSPRVIKAWEIIVGISIIATILAAIPPIWHEVESRFKNIDIEISWYKVDKDNNLNLIPLKNIQVVLNAESLINERISIPINLAIRNKNRKPLEIVKLELTYDKSLDVRSEAKRKVSIEPGRVVFEHNLGFLPVSDSFTPLPTIDILSFPTFFVVEELVIVMADGIPNYNVSVLGLRLQEQQGILSKRRIDIKYIINAKDYPPITGSIVFLFEPVSFDIMWPPPYSDSQTRSASYTDPILKLSELTEGTIIAQWEGIYRDEKVENSRIRYIKKKAKNGTILQLILRDDILRMINIDDDGDGYQERALIDKSGDGVMDKEILFTPKIPMIDWKKEALE